MENLKNENNNNDNINNPNQLIDFYIEKPTSTKSEDDETETRPTDCLHHAGHNLRHVHGTLYSDKFKQYQQQPAGKAGGGEAEKCRGIRFDFKMNLKPINYFQGVPECKSNFDCVVGGVCIKDRGGKGRCFCSSSCPLSL